MSTTSEAVRQVIATPDENGIPTADWKLTDPSITDSVKIQIRTHVLPVIFVPGIMGSNLMTNNGAQTSVWNLDTTLGQPLGLAWDMSGKPAGERQKQLNPAATAVDPGGDVPSHISTLGGNVEEQLRARGWGEVGESSYKKFLKWLETELNPVEANAAKWSGYKPSEAAAAPPSKHGDKPKLPPRTKMSMDGEPEGLTPEQVLMSDDLLKRSKCWMPVHACGYNWLESNKEAAKRLADRIISIINQYNKGRYACSKVVLVTHSMGGLVARACAQIPGIADKIAGVVHGVMPSTGAAVAYRRCKVGMWDEGEVSGFFGSLMNHIAAGVIGKTGKEVTAVFAQAPGALQLLPTQDYVAHGRPDWLLLADDSATIESWPKQNPYDDIYLQRNKWWGLINEDWLTPKDGTKMTWDQYTDNLEEARKFHKELSCKYHPSTYVLYGADTKQPSFESVIWRMRKGRHEPKHPQSLSAQQVIDLKQNDLRSYGESISYVGGEHVESRTMTHNKNTEAFQTTQFETSDWELHCLQQDGAGDGTVPLSSGCAPEQHAPASIKLQRGLTGFSHEPAYKHEHMQRHTLFCINKIVGQTELPT